MALKWKNKRNEQKEACRYLNEILEMLFYYIKYYINNYGVLFFKLLNLILVKFLKADTLYWTFF